MKLSISFYLLTIVLLVSCGTSNDTPVQDNTAAALWSKTSSTVRLYVMEPAEFDVTDAAPSEPAATIFSENIPPELEQILLEIEILANGDGPFPTCFPMPGQENFYLIVEGNDNELRRFAENHGCGGLGVGFPGQTGFFQQPLEGRISTTNFCAISALVGVTSTSCS